MNDGYLESIIGILGVFGAFRLLPRLKGLKISRQERMALLFLVLCAPVTLLVLAIYDLKG
jgi:hypothetical protein